MLVDVIEINETVRCEVRVRSNAQHSAIPVIIDTRAEVDERRRLQRAVLDQPDESGLLSDQNSPVGQRRESCGRGQTGDDHLVHEARCGRLGIDLECCAAKAAKMSRSPATVQTDT